MYNLSSSLYKEVSMRYTKEERLEIGRKIYDDELTRAQAAEIYNISEQMARTYMRLYRDVNGLPPKIPRSRYYPSSKDMLTDLCLEDYEKMSKEELIGELVKTRIQNARLKKGYEVKGDGTVIQYDRKSIK